MKRPKLIMLTAAIVLICITALPGTLSAAEKIRLETLAIRGHSIHKNLLKMGERWKQVSDGAVKLIVYPGGTGGGDALLRKTTPSSPPGGNVVTGILTRPRSMLDSVSGGCTTDD